MYVRICVITDHLNVHVCSCSEKGEHLMVTRRSGEHLMVTRWSNDHQVVQRSQGCLTDHKVANSCASPCRYLTISPAPSLDSP